MPGRLKEGKSIGLSDGIDNDRLSDQIMDAEPLGVFDECSFPEQIFIGYYAHIKKRDLLRFIKGYVDSHCQSPKSSTFQIRKYLHGYLYEIHDGGSAGGVASSVIKLLQAGESPIVYAASRRLKVVHSPDGLSSYLLKEGDDQPLTLGVVYQDKMHAISSGGGSLFAIGVVVFIAGFSVMGAAAVISSNSSIQATPPDFKVFDKITPANGIQEVERQRPQPGQYIDRLQYESGQWEVRLRSDAAYYRQHELMSIGPVDMGAGNLGDYDESMPDQGPPYDFYADTVVGEIPQIPKDSDPISDQVSQPESPRLPASSKPVDELFSDDALLPTSGADDSFTPRAEPDLTPHFIESDTIFQVPTDRSLMTNILDFPRSVGESVENALSDLPSVSEVMAPVRLGINNTADRVRSAVSNVMAENSDVVEAINPRQAMDELESFLPLEHPYSSDAGSGGSRDLSGHGQEASRAILSRLHESTEENQEQ